MTVLTSNIKLAVDINGEKYELMQLQNTTPTIKQINQAIFHLATFLDKKIDSLPAKNLEQKIFNMLYSKFYKKNDTIVMVETDENDVSHSKTFKILKSVIFNTTKHN